MSETVGNAIRRWDSTILAKPIGRYSLFNMVTEGQPVVFVSGQFGVDSDGVLAGPDTAAQARQLFCNLSTSLKELGATIHDLVYLNTYLSQDASVADYLAVRDEVFPTWGLDRGRYPGSTLLVVSRLVDPSYLVEIDALIAVPDSK